MEKTNPATLTHQPDHDVEIEFRLREDHTGGCEVKLSESDVPMEVSAEDMATVDLGA